MLIKCIDLSERFGTVYRVTNEDGQRHRSHDPWQQILLCRHGHIYPHGGDMLGASTDCRGAIANRLAALRCVRVVQDGTDGINAVFHVDDFQTVAAILRARRRRKLTPEQIAERVERLRKHRFPVNSPASQSDFEALRRDPIADPGPNLPCRSKPIYSVGKTIRRRRPKQ